MSRPTGANAQASTPTSTCRGQRRQPPMTVAMKIDRTPRHAVPGAQRIVAKNEPPPSEVDLAIVSNTGPAAEPADVGRVVVAGDQVLAPGEPGQQRLYAFRASGARPRRPGARPRHHRRQGHSNPRRGPRPSAATELERATKEPKRSAVAEVGVGREPDRRRQGCSVCSGRLLVLAQPRQQLGKVAGLVTDIELGERGYRPSRRGRRRASLAGRRCRCPWPRRHPPGTAGWTCRSWRSSACGTARRSREWASRPPVPAPLASHRVR